MRTFQTLCGAGVGGFLLSAPEAGVLPRESYSHAMINNWEEPEIIYSLLAALPTWELLAQGLLVCPSHLSAPVPDGSLPSLSPGQCGTCL